MYLVVITATTTHEEVLIFWSNPKSLDNPVLTYVLIILVMKFLSIFTQVDCFLWPGECKCPAGFKGMDCEIPCERGR